MQHVLASSSSIHVQKQDETEQTKMKEMSGEKVILTVRSVKLYKCFLREAVKTSSFQPFKSGPDKYIGRHSAFIQKYHSINISVFSFALIQPEADSASGKKLF